MPGWLGVKLMCPVLLHCELESSNYPCEFFWSRTMQGLYSYQLQCSRLDHAFIWTLDALNINPSINKKKGGIMLQIKRAVRCFEMIFINSITIIIPTKYKNLFVS